MNGDREYGAIDLFKRSLPTLLLRNLAYWFLHRHHLLALWVYRTVVPLTLDHRAWTAARALSLRCAGVNLAALAGPPFFPPSFPSFEKYARSSDDNRFAATKRLYETRSRIAIKK